MSNSKAKKTPPRRDPHVAGAGTEKQTPPPEHIPETAENFEHTIRRLVIEKEKEREKSFWLYR